MVSSGLYDGNVEVKISSEEDDYSSVYFTQASIDYFWHKGKLSSDANHIIKYAVKIVDLYQL